MLQLILIIAIQVYVLNNIVGLFQRNLDEKRGVLSPDSTSVPKKKKAGKGSQSVLRVVESDEGAEELKEDDPESQLKPSAQPEIIDLTGEFS